MSERTKLLKKAVLTGVGATTNGDRIKSALQDAMQDLVKIGQELFDELEDKGKVKAKNAQEFVKGLKDEAGKRSNDFEKRVSTNVNKAVRDFGLVTRKELEEIEERVQALEDALGGSTSSSSKETPKKRGRKPNH